MNRQNEITVNEAIKTGNVRVNGPVFLLIFAPVLLSIFLPKYIATNSFVGISLVVCIALAWLWWSWMLPKWRLWAFENVDDIEHLIDRAIQSNLMWPPGHFFQKTEIKTNLQKQKMERILRQKLQGSEEYKSQLISKLNK